MSERAEIVFGDAHILGLHQLWCRPHKWFGGGEEVELDLMDLGFMERDRHVGWHPLTRAGCAKCVELIKSGEFARAIAAAEKSDD